MKKHIDKFLKVSKKYIRQTKKKIKKSTRMHEHAQIPEPNHKMGYTGDFIETFLSKSELKKFWQWMRGQTCTRDEKTKEFVYYTYDVVRFVEMTRKNIPTLWD